MFKVINKVARNRILLDLLSLFPPLFMIGAAIVPIFFGGARETLIQAFLIAYFLTVFLIRLISIIMRNRANEHDNPIKANIAKANIMIVASVLSFIESFVIMLAFFFIIFSQKDKGFFASSIYTALIYSGFFIVRLIFNLVKIFGGIYSKDSYDRTVIYMESVTLLYMMVVSFNYLLSALQIGNLGALILQSVLAGLSILAIFIVCIVMFTEGIRSKKKYKLEYREEIKTLKKSKRAYLKEEKARRKSEKITDVEVISDDDIEYMEDEKDVRFTSSDQ